jgi:eukaryotic-like serine/threonine-protein kinase
MKLAFKIPPWIFPLLIAALVAAFGWWGNGRVRETIRQELRAQLTATLNANVTALDIWTTNQLKLASALASEPTVRNFGTRLLTGSSDRIAYTPRSDAERLGNYLHQRLNVLGYEIAQVVNTNCIVVATSEHNWQPAALPVSEAHTNKFAELFAFQKPVLITPFKPELLMERRALRLGSLADTTNSFAYRKNHLPPTKNHMSRRGDRALMQVAAPLRANDDAICGALALVINPDNEFSRILSVARAGESGETYAFDQTGLLISRSRHDAELHKFGLLAITNTSSALNLRLRDPGGDLTQGFRLDTNEDTPHPLIRLVEDAVAGESGVDLEPSRDYRGVPVVGAWRWLPGLGFGVATQMDATEAYRPLHLLQLLFILLTLMLILCAVGMFVYSYAGALSRQRLDEAELKLKQLGQYTLEKKIGEGGMGVVYLARHAMMRRETAVKLLLPNRADAAAVARFEREVCLTCQLTHPNTIQVYDYGHTPDGIFYYAMEFLRGLNLHDLVARFGSLPEERVLHILMQVCDSLAEAHELGLIHRDIKPGNIFLCKRGGLFDCVKVLDFGLVREYRSGQGEHGPLTNQDMIEGTPWFMPPEAFENPGSSDPRSDIYSIGALGYYLLTGGQYVFEGASLTEIHRQQIETTPLPPGLRSSLGISGELEQIILLCLAANPAERPQSAGELKALLSATPLAHAWTIEKRQAWWANFRTLPELESTSEEFSTPRQSVSVNIADRM